MDSRFERVLVTLQGGPLVMVVGGGVLSVSLYQT